MGSGGMMMGRSRAAILLTLAATLLASASGAFAQATEVRVSRGYSVLYLPQMMMQKHQLIEKQIKKLGLGDTRVVWRVLDGGNVINDALLAGALDIAAVGTPGLLICCQRGLANPTAEIPGARGIG